MVNSTFFMYFSSLLVFTLNRKLLLLMLLSVDYIVVALCTGLFFLLGNMDYNFFLMVFFNYKGLCLSSFFISIACVWEWFYFIFWFFIMKFNLSLIFMIEYVFI